jgi:nucleotide-binding universal stress UspA family protein
MHLLIPVSGSKSSVAAVRHAAGALRGGQGEVTLLNVQPLMPSYIARFTSRASRDALRAERSNQAMREACALLDAAGVRYRAIAERGAVAPTVDAVARQLRVDQILLGATRRAAWWQALFSPVPRILDLADVPVSVIGDGRSGVFERYGVPACVGLGVTALMISAE